MGFADKQDNARGGPSSFHHVSELPAKLRLEWLLKHFSPRLVRAAYAFINGFLTIGLLALLAVITAARLSFHHSVRPHISSSFRPERKPPVHAIPSWGTLLDSSAATLPSRLRRQPAHLSACTRASMAANPGRCAFALGHRCTDGFVPGEPSACRSYDSYCFAWHHRAT